MKRVGPKRQRMVEQVGYVAFDIETSGLIESGKEAPKITCVVTMRMERVRPGKFDLESTTRWHDDLEEEGAFMSVATLQKLISYLSKSAGDGFVPLTWNGAHFDFRVVHDIVAAAGLAEEAAEVKRLARLGVDPMFNFFMHKGFPVGLKRVADGFKLDMNKTGSGADAIEQWIHGGYDGRLGVVDYCENDVGVMVLAVSAIDHRKRITWITKSSNKQVHRGC